MRCDVAVDIDSSPEYVWAVLADVRRWPTWTSAVREVSLPDGGAFRLGSVVRIRSRRLPDRTWRVSSYATYRGFTWSADGLGSRATIAFRLTPGEGTTRLTVAHERGGWIAGAVQHATHRTVENHLQALADGLKARCEQRRTAVQH